MFPIKSSDAYIKDNGKRSTIGAEIDAGGSGGSDLPEYSISDAGKVLTVADDGSLGWDEKGGTGGLFTGTTPPDALLGIDGDIYKQTYATGLLASDGACAIDTGVKPNSCFTIDTNVELLENLASSYDTIFGCRNGDAGRFTLRFDSDINGVLAEHISQSPISSYSPISFSSTTKATMLNTLTPIIFNVGLSIINSQYKSNMSSGNVNVSEFPYSIYLFANNNAGAISDYGHIALTFAKIYNEFHKIVKFFVPAIHDDTPCMYELLSGQYYNNIGAGAFTFTPDNNTDELIWVKINNTWVPQI